MCIAFIHRSRRETRPSSRFGHGCEERAEANAVNHPRTTPRGHDVHYLPPHTSKWCAPRVHPPIPHTDGLRMTHTTGLKHTKHTRPRHHHRPVVTGRSWGLAPPARPRLAPVVGGTIRLCATRDHSRWRRRRKVRRSETRDDAMNLFSSFVRRDTDARARERSARERHRAGERERGLCD